MVLLLVYFSIALGFSFLCSLLEAVLLSVPRTHIRVLIERGEATGARLERMKDDIDQPLAAILTLNTFAHTLGAAGVGAQAAVIWGEASVGIVSFVLTILVLILSEIIPKTLGAVHAKRLAPFASVAIAWLIFVLRPVVAGCNAVSRLLSRRDQSVPNISREEVSNLAQMAHDEGVIDATELSIVRNMVALREIRVEDVMTPRAVVFSYGADETVDGVLARAPSRFARIPIVEGSLDATLGVVHRREVFQAGRDGRGGVTMRELARPVHVVPETAGLAGVMRMFLERNEHLFLVADEYGGGSGIVTLEDAIETLLGAEIVDETDTHTDMRELARRMLEHRHERPRPDVDDEGRGR